MITLQSQTDLINATIETIQTLDMQINWCPREMKDELTHLQDQRFSHARALVELLLQCSRDDMEVQLMDVSLQQVWEDK